MRQKSIYSTRNLFGRSIAYIRRKKGLTQKDLLLRIELQGGTMTQTKLSRIESGNTILLDRDLVVIVAALQVSLNDLYQMMQTEQLDAESVCKTSDCFR